MHNASHSGFTLIEVMIAVVVIGLLAAIALPAYGRYVASARASTALQSLTGSKLLVAEQYSQNQTLNCTGVPNCSGAGVLASAFEGITVTLTPSAPASAGRTVTWACVVTGTNAVAVSDCTVGS